MNEKQAVRLEEPLAPASTPPAVPSTALPEAWTIGRLLNWTAKFLADKGSESARLDAEVLLAHALSCRRIELYTRFEETPENGSRERFRELVRERVEGCPVAYLVGKKEFFALEFEVNRAVLIPRPESEFVVMEFLRLAKNVASPAVVDLGTGSGNIAVSVAKQHPSARVTAVDLSPDALEVAQRNAMRHKVADRIRFLSGDLFAPIPSDEGFDFVLANPPYIPRNDIASLARGVRSYEPHLALDGGADGYAVFDRLIAEAPQRLQPGGYLILEIGAPQEHAARQRLEALAGFELGETIHDYSGHARVLRARRNP